MSRITTGCPIRSPNERQFVARSDVRPATIIDATDWVPAAPITMVLSLQFPVEDTAHWLHQSEAVVHHLSKTEEALAGGAGLELDWKRSGPGPQGKVILTLKPRNPAGAEARLAQLVEWAKGAIPECVGARLAV